MFAQCRREKRLKSTVVANKIVVCNGARIGEFEKSEEPMRADVNYLLGFL